MSTNSHAIDTEARDEMDRRIRRIKTWVSGIASRLVDPDPTAQALADKIAEDILAELDAVQAEARVIPMPQVAKSKPTKNGARPRPSLDPVLKKQFLDALAGGDAKADQLAKRLKIHAGSARRFLGYLRKEGLVSVDKTRHWSAVETA